MAIVPASLCRCSCTERRDGGYGYREQHLAHDAYSIGHAQRINLASVPLKKGFWNLKVCYTTACPCIGAILLERSNAADSSPHAAASQHR